MKLPPEQEAIRAKCFHPSGTFTEFPKEDVETSIPERFEKIVSMYPDRIAVKIDGTALTYDALKKAANRVARVIIDRLGGQNQPVVIFSEQSLTAVILSLGIWKSGKILVAIEPSLPIDQIVSTVRDAEAILATNENIVLALELANKTTVQVINIDTLASDIPDEDLNLPICSETPAEIRYSSGSTGKPKGIVRSHRRLLSSTRSMVNSAHICPEDRLVALTKLSYGGRDLLSCLLSGAALFPFDLEKEGVASLALLLDEEKITWYHSVPSIFRCIVGELSRATTFPFLRLIKLGGDLLFRSDIESYRKYFSDECILVNRLSTGETGNLCEYFIDKHTEVDTEIVPVGYPVEGKSLCLLNSDGEQVGPNEVGVITVRSQNLSNGYWNDRDLTSAKFQTDPETGEKVYLTGDLGKFLPDGRLIYLGRRDHQIKIRGIKVELAEIDAALVEHESVAEAATVHRRTGSLIEESVVAYVVPKKGTRPAVGELRHFIRRTLPDYMMPSRFVFLDSLPLTRNGKVDRPALPEPGDERPNLEDVFVAPQDEVQRALASIWEKLLGVRPIGARDSFFDLGGHSLVAVQLVSEIEKAFTKRLAPTVLFQAPTIEQLAEIIRHGPKSWSNLIPIQPGGSKRPFFWVHGDFSNAYLPRYLGSDQPLYGLEHQSQDGKPARYTSVESIATNYLREIRSVQARGPYYLGGYSFGGCVALEIARQLKEQGQEVALLALLEPPRPIKITDSTSTQVSHGPTNIHRFYSHLHRHSANVSSLGYKRAVGYLWERCAGEINAVRSNISAKVSNGLKRTLIKICLALGKDIPPSVRSRYILDLYHRIRPEYEMKQYSGRVILFKGDDQTEDYVADWERYLVGAKQVYEVRGGHMELREEPYIAGWAEHLKAYLEAAQVTDTPSGR